MARSFIVYRVEHPHDGMGPYNSDIEWPEQYDMCAAHQVGGHPAPWRDTALRMVFRRYGADAQCATVTPEALRDWFAGYWDALDRAGFVVRKIRAYAGSTRGTAGQAVYRASDARILETMEIDTFVSA